MLPPNTQPPVRSPASRCPSRRDLFFVAAGAVGLWVVDRVGGFLDEFTGSDLSNVSAESRARLRDIGHFEFRFRDQFSTTEQFGEACESARQLEELCSGDPEQLLRWRNNRGVAAIFDGQLNLAQTLLKGGRESLASAQRTTMLNNLAYVDYLRGAEPTREGLTHLWNQVQHGDFVAPAGWMCAWDRRPVDSKGPVMRPWFLLAREARRHGDRRLAIDALQAEQAHLGSHSFGTNVLLAFTEMEGDEASRKSAERHLKSIELDEVLPSSRGHIEALTELGLEFLKPHPELDREYPGFALQAQSTKRRYYELCARRDIDHFIGAGNPMGRCYARHVGLAGSSGVDRKWSGPG